MRTAGKNGFIFPRWIDINNKISYYNEAYNLLWVFVVPSNTNNKKFHFKRENKIKMNKLK